MFKGFGGAGAGILTTVFQTGSTIMTKKWEMYASIAAGVLLLITTLMKKK